MKKCLKKLEGKTVSVLVDVAKNCQLKSNYSGIIESVDDGVLTIDTNNPNFFIRKVHVKCDLVLSVWELGDSPMPSPEDPKERIKRAKELSKKN